MQNKDQVAQEVLRLLGEAQSLEEKGDTKKAIEMYQSAADYLKNSGYMLERVSDIYGRIEELRKYMKEQALYQKAQQEAEIEKIQEEAFSILDGASKSEAKGLFEEAIQQYESAITLLSKAGWIESQIQNIKLKIASLLEKIERRKLLQKAQEAPKLEPQTIPEVASSPQITDAFGRKKDIQQAEKLYQYKELKKQEDQIQNDAFTYIDNAKFHERDGKIDIAIENYEKAIELLQSIGWQDQIKNIYSIIDNLKSQKKEITKVQTRSISESSLPKMAPISYAYEEAMQDEDAIQSEAFNLIDIGKKLEREKKFEKAIEKFETAIALFKKIEWDSYIQPILNFIKDIKEKQQFDLDIEVLQKKREEEVERLQNTVFMKEVDQFVESSRDLESKRMIYEQKKKEQEIREKEFFTVLEKADNLLQKARDFNGAIKEYHVALELLSTLGSGWESYSDTIKTTINTIKNLKEEQISKEYQAKLKEDTSKNEELKFQQKILAQLQNERKKILDKELKIELKEEELKYFEQRKQTAFDALDDAQKYIIRGDFDNAIIAYQTAGNIFAGIQWNDELPLIETAIQELENRKREQSISKQRQLEKSIIEYKEEQKFQDLISKRIAAERENLKKKQIILKEQKRELEYRENRRKEAFKLLEESETYLSQGNFDKVLEIYNVVTNIFAEIQWYDELELIGNAVIEIENKRRQQEREKQKEIQMLLENERKEREFQMTIAKAMEEEKHKYRQRQLILKEKEREIEFQEAKKEEGFVFLDKAQNFLSLGKFDMANESYREAAKIFAQIGWKDEIPLILQSIQQIEVTKKEREISKQKQMEKALEEEKESREFMSKFKKEREREKENLELKKIELEKTKQISTETKSKQEEAFKFIDQADMLLTNREFDQALELFQKAITILSSIGWTESYLKLLKDSVSKINSRKKETEQRKIKEREYRIKEMEEEKKFENKIHQQLENEKKRLIAKKIEIQKREEILKEGEKLKEEAFTLMDKAELLLNQGLYDQSIDLYHQAELVFSEIQFPTEPIRGMIDKIKLKKREDQLSKQYEIELQQTKMEEQRKFQEKIMQSMKMEAEKMKAKKISLRKREELRNYMEKRKQDAFELLEQAEGILKLGQYEKSLEYYRSAELIFNEIHFPTDSLKDSIFKVIEKRKEQELSKQQELERQLKKEKEEKEFQQLIRENLNREKERIKAKEVEIEKLHQLKDKVEQKKEVAFDILNKAENYIKKQDYDNAIENYRKAMTILNEIQFPTNTINDMIFKVNELKKKKAFEKEEQLHREFEKLEEEKKLTMILEERKQQEMKKKIAQQIAIQERERIVKEQLSYRDAAYSLLEEAGKYLKKAMPDYDKAISLYIQSRDLLQEKIGWEPEINNLNVLIKDLMEEKENLLEKKRLDEQIRLKRQREYELFQKEIQKRKEEYIKQKREQQHKIRLLLEKRQIEKQLSEEGLTLLDQARDFVTHRNFDEAFKCFEDAIKKFIEIGWDEQIKYIKQEIENTETLHQGLLQEELQIQKLHEELKRKQELEFYKLQEKENELKKAIGEVGDLTGEISNMVSDYRRKAELREQQKQEKLKLEAKKFSSTMGEMIKLKQELSEAISQSKESKEKKEMERELAKDKEKADEIKKMLKDIKKKKKNN